MRVNWSKKAIAELSAITRYIEQDSPDAAERVAAHIFAEVMLLSSMPDQGKPGRVAGTRESSSCRGHTL